MARLRTCGFEVGSVAAGIELSAATGTGALALTTTTVRSGQYALDVNTVAQSAVAQFHCYSAVQARIGYLRAYLYLVSLPSATSQIMSFRDPTGSVCGEVALTGAGKLRLRTASQVQVGADSAALQTGRWYRVELKVDATTTPGSLEAYYTPCQPDGSDPGDGQRILIASASNDATASGAWARATVGSSANVTTHLVFDDVALNDDTGTVQNGYPGSGKVIALSPNGAGDTNQWLKNSGGAGDAANWQLVDELPPNDATDYVQSGLSGTDPANAVDEYNLTDSGIGANAVISVVETHARIANVTAAATTQARTRLRKGTGGPVVTSAALAPNTTTWRTDYANNTVQGVDGQGIAGVWTTDPSGAAWTAATLDSLQVGVSIPLQSTRRVAVTALWVTVEYVPPASISGSEAGSASEASQPQTAAAASEQGSGLEAVAPSGSQSAAEAALAAEALALLVATVAGEGALASEAAGPVLASLAAEEGGQGAEGEAAIVVPQSAAEAALAAEALALLVATVAGEGALASEAAAPTGDLARVDLADAIVLAGVGGELQLFELIEASEQGLAAVRSLALRESLGSPIANGEALGFGSDPEAGGGGGSDEAGGAGGGTEAAGAGVIGGAD